MPADRRFEDGEIITILDKCTGGDRQAWFSMTHWARIESEARSDDLELAVRAEVHDPLWLLGRQWQLGEFEGEDAASPIRVNAWVEDRPLSGVVALGQEVAGCASDVSGAPMEYLIERRPYEPDLYLKALMGHEFSRIIVDHSLAVDLNPYHLDLGDAEQLTGADAEARADLDILGGAVDGWRILLDAVKLVDDSVAGVYRDFCRSIGVTLDACDCWNPSRLEYDFGLVDEAAGNTHHPIYSGNRYAQGDFDWYSVDAVRPGDSADVDHHTELNIVAMPTRVTFAGMPRKRWWAFEDEQVRFVQIAPDSTDICKLLLMEFAMLYSNDWMMVPLSLTNSGAQVNEYRPGHRYVFRRVEVLDTFGGRTEHKDLNQPRSNAIDDPNAIRPTGWSVFCNTQVGGGEGGTLGNEYLFVNSAVHRLEGAPIEEVLLVRDEVANMVWGIEQTIMLPSGYTRSGRQAAESRLRARERAGPEPEGSGNGDGPAAELQYRLMSRLDEYWIPFIPVLDSDFEQEGGSAADVHRPLRLQRGSVISQLGKIAAPRTSLLRIGLDQGTPYRLYQEEVPPGGIRVTQSFQRARAIDGSVVVWLGARKYPATGASSSGIRFDLTESVSP